MAAGQNAAYDQFNDQWAHPALAFHCRLLAHELAMLSGSRSSLCKGVLACACQKMQLCPQLDLV